MIVQSSRGYPAKTARVTQLNSMSPPSPNHPHLPCWKWRLGYSPRGTGTFSKKLKPSSTRNSHPLGISVPLPAVLQATPMRQGNACHRRTSGFTLIELLVVILIIAILAVLAFGASRRMISSAQSAICLSNLRHTHALIATIISDKGAYPAVTSDPGQDLASLIGYPKCRSCPAAKYSGLETNGRAITAHGVNPTVILQTSINNVPPLVRPGQISRPSEVFLLADCLQYGGTEPRTAQYSVRLPDGSISGNPKDAEKLLTKEYTLYQGKWDELMPTRHNGRANILFCDGHAASVVPLGELKQKNVYRNY